MATKEELKKLNLPTTIIVDEDNKQTKYCLEHEVMINKYSQVGDKDKKMYIYAYRDYKGRVAWAKGEKCRIHFLSIADTRDAALNGMKKRILEYKNVLKKPGSMFND